MKIVNPNCVCLYIKILCVCMLRYCSEKCRSILSLMLPEETPPQVWKVAALISYRQALDKVNKWLSMHITTRKYSKVSS